MIYVVVLIACAAVFLGALGGVCESLRTPRIDWSLLAVSAVVSSFAGVGFLLVLAAWTIPAGR